MHNLNHNKTDGRLCYPTLAEKRMRGIRSFAVLLDPDECSPSTVGRIVDNALDCGVDLFFVGGSLVVGDDLDRLISSLKSKCDIPVILFPGSIRQLSSEADALLFLSLISGRNPDMLIGQQVLAAPHIKRSGLEVLPTGYMLVDGGRPTTASYMSGTFPIPADKPEIAVSTALAGELLGLKLIYLDAGSGAAQRVPDKMIAAVNKQVSIPIIVGGGIRSADQAAAAASAGADVIVVGNALEDDPGAMRDISLAIHSVSIPSRSEG